MINKTFLLSIIFWMAINYACTEASSSLLSPPTNSTFGQVLNFYYDSNGPDELNNGWPAENEENSGDLMDSAFGGLKRKKRLVISGLGATILWSIFFTPLATMTVSKNYDLLAIFRRCQDRGKAHFEDKSHLLPALWKTMVCQQTEAEMREKELLIKMVVHAFKHLTAEARELLEFEYAVFEDKMAKLRGDKDQVERMKWNVPGHRGKIFLCFLREYVLFDESSTSDSDWRRQFDSDADKGQEFWRYCEASIEKRREMGLRERKLRSLQLWYGRETVKIGCLKEKIVNNGVSWLGKMVTNIFGKGEERDGNEEKQEQANGEQERPKLSDECEPKKTLLQLLREADGEWPSGYVLEEEEKDHNSKSAEAFFNAMTEQLDSTREKTRSIFSNYLMVNETRVEVDWAKLQGKGKDKLYYPKFIRAIVEETLEETRETLEHYNLANKISEEQMKHFAMLEIRTTMARFFVELRGDEQLREIFFPTDYKKYGFASNRAKNVYAKQNEVNRDMLVSGNDLHMVEFSAIFKIQDENKELYMKIILDALLSDKKEEETGEKEQSVENKMIGRKKRAIGPIATLLFGMGMQQGYRHFNLIQLIRDCTVRSVNYLSFRCSLPPIIQEEIKFIQKAKEIAFQMLPPEAVPEISRKLGFYVKEYLRQKSALVEVPLELLEENLNLDNGSKSVPVPIRTFKRLIKEAGHTDNIFIAVPSEQLREAIHELDELPGGKDSLKNIASAINGNAKVHLSLELFEKWEKELELTDKEKVPKKEVEYCKNRGLKMVRVKGSLVAKRLASGLDVPNPKETVAPILKDGILVDVSLSLFTDNEKLDELALLHTPVEKLKQIFDNNKLVNIALPINFLAYKMKKQLTALNVPFKLLREWMKPGQHIPVQFDSHFVGQMREKGIRAIPVSTYWLVSSCVEKEQINVAGEHFVVNYEYAKGGQPIRQYPMLLELKKKYNKCVKFDENENKGAHQMRGFIKRTAFPKPTATYLHELPFSMDDLKRIDYLALEMAEIKFYMDQANRKRGINSQESFGCPQNIIVTLEWLEDKLDANASDPFIVPIFGKFFEEIVFNKNWNTNGKVAKAGADGKMPEEELSVSVAFLADIMKSSQKIPVPSQMLLDAGLELPWKYARRMDCHAQYLFYDEEVMNRCRIYREQLAAKILTKLPENTRRITV